MLMIDAFDRPKETGVPVKMNKVMNKVARRIIYGFE